MILSKPRKKANDIVAHVHFASKSTQFNVSFDNDTNKFIMLVMDDSRKSTCEFHMTHQVRNLAVADLIKLGYTQI